MTAQASSIRAVPATRSRQDASERVDDALMALYRTRALVRGAALITLPLACDPEDAGLQARALAIAHQVIRKIKRTESLLGNATVKDVPSDRIMPAFRPMESAAGLLRAVYELLDALECRDDPQGLAQEAIDLVKLATRELEGARASAVKAVDAAVAREAA